MVKQAVEQREALQELRKLIGKCSGERMISILDETLFKLGIK